jgi:hypothetical protein
MQKRDVVVYRLITCGTVEEKIYRKQVGHMYVLSCICCHACAASWLTLTRVAATYSWPDKASELAIGLQVPWLLPLNRCRCSRAA